jgi:outer membrane protein TolC
MTAIESSAVSAYRNILNEKREKENTLRELRKYYTNLRPEHQTEKFITAAEKVYANSPDVKRVEKRIAELEALIKETKEKHAGDPSFNISGGRGKKSRKTKKSKKSARKTRRRRA